MADLWSTILQLAGTAGGAAIGGPIGAEVGGSLGKLAGGQENAGVSTLNAAGMSIPGLPLAEGGIELISGLAKQHQANKLKQQLNQPDPRLTQFMDEIDRQRKSFETGSAYGSEMRELKNLQSATQAGIVQAAKGSTGSALAAIEQTGLNAALGYGKIAAQGQQRQDMYTQMYGQMVSQLEQRKYEQNAYMFQQAQADARQQKLAGTQTLLNAAALGKKTPQTGGQDMSAILEMLNRLAGMKPDTTSPYNTEQFSASAYGDYPTA